MDQGFDPSYADEIRDRLDDGESASKIAKQEDVPVEVIESLRRGLKPYLILGHGNDICKNGKLEVLDVPKGCVYVTFTQCGLVNFVGSNVNKFFKQDNIQYLKNPVKYESELKKIFGNEIHIHHSEAKNKTSRTYVNNSYTLAFNSIQANNKCLMGTSGFIPLPVPKNTEFISERMDCFDRPKLDKFYKHAIYPRMKDVESAISKRQDMYFSHYLKKITQKELFEMYPGIHYNFLCRVTDKECDKNALKRQQESAVAAKPDKEVQSVSRYIERLAYNCIKNEDYCKQMHLTKLKPMLVNFTEDDLIKLGARIEGLWYGDETRVMKLHRLADKFYKYHQKGKGRTQRHKRVLHKTAKRY